MGPLIYKQQFYLNTNGYCFLCFKPEKEPYPSFHSNPRFPLHILTHYLDIPEVRETSHISNLNSNNGCKVVTVSLCEDCLQLMTSVFQLIFVKQCVSGPLAEVTKMRLSFLLSKLRKMMKEAEGTSGGHNLALFEQEERDWLRKEIEGKCIADIRKCLGNPRVLATKLDPNWKWKRARQSTTQLKQEMETDTTIFSDSEDVFLPGLSYPSLLTQDSISDSKPVPVNVPGIGLPLTKTEPVKEWTRVPARIRNKSAMSKEVETGGDFSDDPLWSSSPSSSEAKLSDAPEEAVDPVQIVNQNEDQVETKPVLERIIKLPPGRRRKPRQPLSSYPCIVSKSGFKCRLCGKEYTTRMGYYFHHQSVHLKTRFQCTKCFRTFAHTETLKLHKRHVNCLAEKPKPTVFCTYPDCRKGFKDRHALRNHTRRLHENPRFECDQCRTNFRHLGALRQHRKEIHQISPERLRCDVDGCEKSYVDRINLLKHLKRSHGFTSQNITKTRECFGKFQCSKCGLRFTQEEKLKSHKRRRHRFDKFQPQPVVCKPFAVSKQVAKSNPCKTCKICGKSFLNTQGLGRHMSIVHLKLKGPFPCGSCDKQFNFKKELRIHQRSHLTFKDSKPFPCPTQGCRSAYSARRKLVRHLKRCNPELLESSSTSESGSDNDAEIVNAGD